MGAVARKGEDGGTGQEQAEARHDNHNRQHHAGQSEPARKRRERQRNDAQCGHPQRPTRHVKDAEPGQQPRIDLGAEDEPGGAHAIQHAITRGRQPEMPDIHGGRAADIGEHGEHRAGAEAHVQQEAALPQDVDVACEQRTRPKPDPAVLRERLRQQVDHQDQRQRAMRGRHPEDGMPGEHRQQGAAQSGGKDRRHPHHQHELGDQPCGSMAVGQVTHDGAGQHCAG